MSIVDASAQQITATLQRVLTNMNEPYKIVVAKMLPGMIQG